MLLDTAIDRQTLRDSSDAPVGFLGVLGKGRRNHVLFGDINFALHNARRFWRATTFLDSFPLWRHQGFRATELGVGRMADMNK